MAAITRTLLLTALLLLGACSPVGPGGHGTRNGQPEPDPDPTPPDTSEPEAAPGFPTGWQLWSKINTTPIVREDTSEVRELFENEAAVAHSGGAFPTGSVLVKAHYRLHAGQKGALYQLSVMTKGTGSEYSGWEFRAFDPRSGEPVDADSEVCALCHSQAMDSDYVISR